jgi:N utilization substance protein B
LTETSGNDEIRFSGRRFSRVLAIQALYRNELLNEDLKDALADAFEREERLPEDVRAFATELVESFAGNRTEVDELLRATSEHWEMDRIHLMDKVILRMAVAEMMGVPGIPFKVSISEAIELAKAFSTDESGRFVNGVLDGVARKLHLKGEE